MIEELPEGKKTQLAVAVAQGISVAAWARTNEVPRATAYRWAIEPEVRRAVEACRRRIVDQAVGKMTKKSNWAVDRIVKLADIAESESVRLRALRSILSEMMAVSKYSGLESRMVEIEEELREQRAGHQGRPG